MRIRNIFYTIAAAAVLSSCGTPKEIVYFQDATFQTATDSIADMSDKYITMQPGDRITIVVKSKDPVLADLFNLPVVGHRVGYTPGMSSTQNQDMSCYTVDPQGDIDFPILGKVRVEGLTRSQVAAVIKDRLISNDLIKDPVVTVDYANLYVSVLGEVTKPGKYIIDNDKVTLLDAIGLAGDLTIYGKRTDVIVIREVDGKPTYYKVDLTSAKKLNESPVYYLKQKDVVYVVPNDTKARTSTVNGNNIRSTSFWISLASLLTTVAVLVFK